jgi:hypothetical protein
MIREGRRRLRTFLSSNQGERLTAGPQPAADLTRPEILPEICGAPAKFKAVTREGPNRDLPRVRKGEDGGGLVEGKSGR